MNARDIFSLSTDQWGMWRLERSNWTLLHTGVNGGYEIDLERINTTGEMLDWIFQLSGKSWATREDIGYLVEAFDDIFHPQEFLCSGGASGSINASEFLKQR